MISKMTGCIVKVDQSQMFSSSWTEASLIGPTLFSVKQRQPLTVSLTLLSFFFFFLFNPSKIKLYWIKKKKKRKWGLIP